MWVRSETRAIILGRDKDRISVAFLAAFPYAFLLANENNVENLWTDKSVIEKKRKA